MRRVPGAALAILLACIFLLLRAPLWGKPPAETIQWQTDLQKAHILSAETQKPMLIVIGANWCTHCRKLEKDTLSDSQMAKFVNSTFVPVHLDFDKEQKIASVLGVEYLPHVTILNPDADLLGEVVGYVRKEKFQAALDKALQLDSDLKSKPRQALATKPRR